MALEGVRGLAALVVVLHHFALAFYPMIHFGPFAVQHMRFEDNLHGTPLGILTAGTFAVALFFVLSGFVLSIGFFQTGNEAIIKKLATKRYFRLMLPALAATLICLILIKFGLAGYLHQAASITQSKWLSEQWLFDADIFNALYSGTIGIFVEGQSLYNNVLWTMLIEFLGSFMVFGFILLFGKSKHRWVSYILLSVLTFNTWFLPFVVGVVIADLYVSGKLEVFRRARWTIPFLTIGLILGAYPGAGIQFTPYAFLEMEWLKPVVTNFQILYLTIGATLTIMAVLLSRRLADLLERPKISGLGKYTFALYLIHLPILYSVVMVVFTVLIPHMGYNFAVLVALLVAIPTIWSATLLFEKYIDTPSIRFAKYFEDVFEGRTAVPVRKYAARFRRRAAILARTLRRTPEIEEAPAE